MDDDMDEDANDDPVIMTCEEHGSATMVFVCSHLLEEPIQRWHSGCPSPENPWPDAWCDQCNAAFLKEGEWNAKNSDMTDIRPLCHHCYELARGASVAGFEEAKSEGWRSYVKTCTEALQAKQEKLERDYSLSRYKRFDWDQQRAELVFSNGGAPGAIATVEFVGSVSTHSGTWLWSWANPSVLESVRSRIEEVYDFGEGKDFPYLTVPQWPAETADGWEMAAVAAQVLDAAGVYRAPDSHGFTFLLIMEVRTAQ